MWWLNNRKIWCAWKVCFSWESHTLKSRLDISLLWVGSIKLVPLRPTNFDRLGVRACSAEGLLQPAWPYHGTAILSCVGGLGGPLAPVISLWPPIYHTSIPQGVIYPSRAVVSTRGNFIFQGTFSNVWRGFRLSELGEVPIASDGYRTGILHNILRSPGQVFPTKNYPVQNASDANTEKPWSGQAWSSGVCLAGTLKSHQGRILLSLQKWDLTSPWAEKPQMDDSSESGGKAFF